jgi:hypothetical protein
MKTHLTLGLLLSSVLAATVAHADDKAACLDATSKGQKFRDAHKLVEAREQFRLCAAAHCPSVVQTDCASWLVEVDRALPGVVVTAKNAAGGDLFEVKVSVDGQPLLSKLDGQSVPMNAGPHTFHFEGNGASVDEQVLVREGEKSQSIAVVLAAAPRPVTVVTASPAQPAQPSPPPAGSAAASSGSSSPWRAVGWLLSGVGVVGLGVGGVAGLVAIGDKNGAHCDANNVCDPGTTDGIKNAALVSDMGLVAGGVLLASGLTMLLFTTGGSQGTATGVRVTPIVTANGAGGVVVGGSW